MIGDEEWLKRELAKGRDHVTDQDIEVEGDDVRKDVSKALTERTITNPMRRNKKRRNKRRRRK